MPAPRLVEKAPAQNARINLRFVTGLQRCRVPFVLTALLQSRSAVQAERLIMRHVQMRHLIE